MTDAPLRAALEEVFLRHRDIDFDWYGWAGRARQALATPPVVVQDDTAHGDVGAAGGTHKETT